jgi:hypothetical protein
VAAILAENGELGARCHEHPLDAERPRRAIRGSCGTDAVAVVLGCAAHHLWIAAVILSPVSATRNLDLDGSTASGWHFFLSTVPKIAHSRGGTRQSNQGWPRPRQHKDTTHSTSSSLENHYCYSDYSSNLSDVRGAWPLLAPLVPPPAHRLIYPQ